MHAVAAVSVVTVVITPPAGNDDGRDRAALPVHPHAALHRRFTVGSAALGVALPRLRMGRQSTACGNEDKSSFLKEIM